MGRKAIRIQEGLRTSVASTLDWFHDGAWRGFGRFANDGFTRIR